MNKEYCLTPIIILKLGHKHIRVYDSITPAVYVTQVTFLKVKPTRMTKITPRLYTLFSKKLIRAKGTKVVSHLTLHFLLKICRELSVLFFAILPLFPRLFISG